MLPLLKRGQVRGRDQGTQVPGLPLASVSAVQCMLESLSQLESLTPSFSFYPSGLKKCVFSHQFILCGLSYKMPPLVFPYEKHVFHLWKLI